MSVKGKTQIKPYVTPEARRLLKTYCLGKRMSESSVVETALREYLGDTHDSVLLMRRLDRNDRNVERAHRDLGILTELFASFLRVWYAHTPPLREADKDTAQRTAKFRYEQLIDHVAERVKGGRGLNLEAMVAALGDKKELAAAAAASATGTVDS